MPRTKISEYSSTANSNTDVASVNIDEGCAPSGINNAIRAVMGHLKDFQSGTNADPFNGPVNGTLGATTPASAAVTTLTTSSTVTHNGGTANGVAYLNGSKVLTTGSALVFDGTNLGLGVTPSAWGTGKAIQGDGGSVWFRGVSGGINCVYNYAFTAAANRYIANGYASRYTQLDGQHIFYTAPSGTAGNAISFTQAMTLDASGNLVVGTTTALSSSSGRIDFTLNGASSGGIISFGTGGVRKGYIYQDSTDFTIANEVSGAMRFINNGSERARIDSSGNLLVAGGISSSPWNVTGNVGWGASINSTYGLTANNNNTLVGIFNRTNGVGGIIEFKYNGSAIGSVSTNGTSASYNTSSDYRLKENIAPITGALAKVSALKPVTYTWKADGSAGEGFIAHELAEVCPQAVTGEKDAVDAEGKPQYQGIDVSFLVGTLTAAIQEQQAMIEQLKADVAALKAA